MLIHGKSEQDKYDSKKLKTYLIGAAIGTLLLVGGYYAFKKCTDESVIAPIREKMNGPPVGLYTASNLESKLI